LAGIMGESVSLESLFSGGRQGWAYSFDDYASSTFQDSAGTTPGAVNSLVGKILDKSGRANHATAASTGHRPTLAVDGSGKAHLYYDGTSSLGLSTGSINLTASSKLTVFVAALKTDTAPNNILVRLNASAAQGQIDIRMDSTAVLTTLRGSTDARLQRSLGAAVGSIQVMRFEYDLSGATVTDEIKAYRNDDPTGWAISAAGPAGSGNFGNAPLYVGNWWPGTFNYAWKGRIYGLVGIVGELTTSEIAFVQRWLADRAGVSYPFAYDPVVFYDTRAASYVNTDEYQIPSSMATAHYDTSATSATVDYVSTSGAAGGFYSIGVFVNGAYNQSIVPGASIGQLSSTILLPAGSKRVTFVNSQWVHNGANNPLGAFMRKITMAGAAKVNPAPTDRAIFYGDSIIGGGHASPIHQYGLPALLRAAAPAGMSVAFEQASGRSLRDDCVDATARAAFVAKIVQLATGFGTSSIWLQIGVNDYGQAAWNATAFGVAYAAMLDDLHAALPGMTITAQSPIVRTVESANAAGSTLGDYRAAIQSACSTRAWAGYVNGSTIITDTAQLADGTHPNNTGNATYAAFIIDALGW
jgi:lysophospholipase L1-like esterase